MLSSLRWSFWWFLREDGKIAGSHRLLWSTKWDQFVIHLLGKEDELHRAELQKQIQEAATFVRSCIQSIFLNIYGNLLLFL